MRIARRYQPVLLARLKPPFALGFLGHVNDSGCAPFERRLRNVVVGERPVVERAQSQQTPIRPHWSPTPSNPLATASVNEWLTMHLSMEFLERLNVVLRDGAGLD